MEHQVCDAAERTRMQRQPCLGDLLGGYAAFDGHELGRDGAGGDVDAEAAQQRRVLSEAEAEPVGQPRPPEHGLSDLAR